MTIAEEKQAQRTRRPCCPQSPGCATARRRQRGAVPTGYWNWTPTAPAHTLLLYAAFGGEADLAAVAAEAARQGKDRWPTRCAARALPLPQPYRARTAGRWDSTASARRYRSAPRFCSRSSWIWCWCPGTAFDADCYRVGMGKGYYDRYLPRCTKAAKIGIALEVQRVAHAAVDEHDQRLDAFVTERGLYTWT